MKTAEKKDGAIICDCCHCELNTDAKTYETADGETICEECKEMYYFTCSDCGELHYEDDRVCVERVGGYDDVCVNCFESNAETYTTCAECGEPAYLDDCEYVHFYGYVCVDCISDGDFCQCEQCGEYYRAEDVRSTNYGNTYCEDCYDDIFSRHIYDYHCGPSLEMRNPDENELTLGFELELNGGGCSHEFLDYIHHDARVLDDVRYKAERDSSLDEDGVEIISAPFGVSQWDKVSREIDEIAGAAGDYGLYTNSETGLHVHISHEYFNTNYDNMKYILAMCLMEHVLINWCDDEQNMNYYDYTGRRLNHWCSTTHSRLRLESAVLNVLELCMYGGTGPKFHDTLKATLNNLREVYADIKPHGTHNEGINAFSSHNTCELRFCASSTDAETVKARIQFAVGLAGWARDMAERVLYLLYHPDTHLSVCVFTLEMLQTVGRNILNAGISGIHSDGFNRGCKTYNVIEL